MLPDLVTAAAQPFALELLERTASTPRVQQVVQLSLAPAFLLGAIGAIMNVMMARLIWLAGRIERLEENAGEKLPDRTIRELHWLSRRRRCARWAIMFSSAAAVIISAVIGLLFIAAYITLQIGTLIALLWVATMAMLMTGLGFFLAETRLAAIGYQGRDSSKSEL